MSGFSQSLQILPPNLTTQIFLVYESDIFFSNFSKNLPIPKYFKFPTLQWGAVRVLSGVTNIASKSDVFMIFSKFFRKLSYKKRTKFEILNSVVFNVSMFFTKFELN